LYKKINESTISITDFREKVIEELLFPNTQTIDENQEDLVSKSPSHKTRKYCRDCYNKKMEGLIEKNHVNKVSTYCEECDEQPHYCLECFENFHN
jgi:hypothetical protein